MTQSVYFAFHDGIFGYDCSRCDALCCRGQGMGGVRRSEIDPLLKRYPSLALFTTSVLEEDIQFATPRGRCFFLQDDRLCRIEVEQSRELKPKVCKLFPFNDFHHLEDTLVVRPNFLCPLSISQGNNHQTSSSYAHLKKEYLPYGNLTHGTPKVRTITKIQANSWVSREREWLRATDEVVRDPSKSKEWLVNWLNQFPSNEMPLLQDLKDPAIDAGSAQMLISLLPSLRLELTHLEQKSQDDVLGLIFRLLGKTISDTAWSPGLQGLNSLSLSLIERYEWLIYDPTLIKNIVATSDSLPTSKEFKNESQDALSLGILTHLLQSGLSVSECIQSLSKDYESLDYFYQFLGKVGRLYRSELLRFLGEH